MAGRTVAAISLPGTLLWLALLFIPGCTSEREPPVSGDPEMEAPGAPGRASVWAFAGKTGIGTSYEQYADGSFRDDVPTGKVSRVWFSIAQGILTETMYGLIHEAQLSELQLVLAGDGFVDQEKLDTRHSIEYLHQDAAGRPLSLAYRLVNRDLEDKYEVEKHLFTDPDRDVLFMRVILRTFAEGVTPYIYLNPHVNNTGDDDLATARADALCAEDGQVHLCLKSTKNFAAASAGFVGVSDGMTDLQDNGVLDWRYANTGSTPGNVALTAQLERSGAAEQVYDFAIGFAADRSAAETAAQQSLDTGYDKVLANYNGQGARTGWEDYLASLEALPGMVATTTDGGKLLYASALALKAQEDKTHAGALIASLSNPWGTTASAAQSKTGYKAVWPRDFYQCAMALLALGDRETPLASFEYLPKVQVTAATPGNRGASGWFLQKTHVDGEVEWTGVQLDQTAMPIMLGWKLWQAGILSDERLVEWYGRMLKPAADFLVSGGDVAMRDTRLAIVPPWTHQERWEEQGGYSPSTTAAVIAGLVTAADIARLANDSESSRRYLETADRYAGDIEKILFTTTGLHTAADTGAGDINGRYFLRITGNTDPNDGGKLGDSNGLPGLNETAILDGGFLELVRFGVRAADDPYVLDTLPEYDDMGREDNLRVKYEFTFPGESGTYPGWRRYGNDGYGEVLVDGSGYHNARDSRRGRVWPFFTGERGHYELARALARSSTIDREQLDTLRSTYVRAMELFANEGLMLPEQVWDGVGANDVYGYQVGEGTSSATPLAWTHAEYVKLVRSISDRQVWDFYPIVAERYQE